MLSDILRIMLSIVAIVALLVFLAWLFYFQYDYAVPVTGRVVEKIEAGTGYNIKPRHVLKLDVGGENYIYITTSARVYGVVAVGINYKFTGPRSGASYDSAEVVE